MPQTIEHICIVSFSILYLCLNLSAQTSNQVSINVPSEITKNRVSAVLAVSSGAATQKLSAIAPKCTAIENTILKVNNDGDKSLTSILVIYRFVKSSTVLRQAIVRLDVDPARRSFFVGPLGSISRALAREKNDESSTSAAAGDCEIAARRFSLQSDQTLEIQVDSIVFEGGILSGPDSFGLVRQSKERARALEDVLEEVKSVEDLNSVQLKMQQNLQSTRGKLDPVKRGGDPDFYSRGLFEFSRFTVSAIAAGQSKTELESGLTKLLETSVKKMILRKEM